MTRHAPSLSTAAGGIVGYYRVSTTPQAETGWSLESQRAAVHRYAKQKAQPVIAEYEEVESAFRRVSARTPMTLDHRPELAKALETCRRSRATLVIAALDRLARNVVFVATLVQSRVNFVALDLPEGTTPFIIHIYAAMAEEESRAKGRARSAALALLKAQGIETWNVRRTRAARERAEAMRPAFETIRAETGIHGALPMTKELVRRNIAAPDGRPWRCSRVDDMLRLLGLHEPERDRSNRRDAEARERELLPRIAAGQKAGKTLGEIAQELNDAGFRTARGALWNSGRLRNFRGSRKRVALALARKADGDMAAAGLASAATER